MVIRGLISLITPRCDRSGAKNKNMANIIKDGVKLFMPDADDGHFEGDYLRYYDQMIRSEIFDRLRCGMYNKLDYQQCDRLDDVIKEAISPKSVVIEMTVYDTTSYLVDNANEIDVIMKRVDLCGRIYSERKKQGMSQARLSEKTGLPIKTISMLERGLWNPTADILIKIGDALGMDLRFEKL